MSSFTKKQHYVPQFLLNNFATKEKSEYRLNVFDIAKNKLRQNQNVKHVCSQNYFYDQDNLVEKILAEKVEAPAANVIQLLCSSHPQVSINVGREILHFISVQLLRTAETFNQSQVALNSITKTVFRELARLNDLDEDAAEKVRIRPKNSRTITSWLALIGYYAALLIHDLKQHLVINRTTENFIISDHPVVHCNSYLYGYNICNAGSLSVAGVQLFLPLSPDRLLCLYDPRIYKYGKKNSCISQVESLETVRSINTLQLRNSPQYIMASKQEDYEIVQPVIKKWRSQPIWEYWSFYNPAAVASDGNMKSQHAATARVQLPPQVVLPFFKMKNKVRRRQIIAEDRIPGSTVAAFERLTKITNSG